VSSQLVCDNCGETTSVDLPAWSWLKVSLLRLHMREGDPESDSPKHFCSARCVAQFYAGIAKVEQ
jgi:hypothetical protein